MKKTKIKIIYVITRLICGGAQKVLISLAAALDKEKYQVIIVAGDLPKTEKDLVSFLNRQGIRLICVKELIREVDLFKDIVATLRLYFIFKKEGADIIHTHTSKAGALGRIAAFFAKAPVIIHSPHGNIFAPEGRIPGVSDRPLARAIFLFIERILGKITDKITTLSDNERSQYVKLKIGKPGKFLTVYNGIDDKGFSHSEFDVNRQEFGLRDDDFIVGSIGRLDPEKGHIYLLEAAVGLSRNDSKIKFIFIGDGSSRKELQDYVNRQGIGDSVRFLGERKDILALLSLIDVFVLPSLYEGLGIAVLEAMAGSVPVIASRVGGVPEIVIDKETGILIPPADSRAIVDSINFLRVNKEKAREISKHARERLGKYFGINSMVEKNEKLYNGLLSAKVYNKGGQCG